MAHPKGVLIERLQKDGRQPQFKTESTGPDHEPTFLSDVMVEGEVLGTGQGGTKRDAERRAAEEALRLLDRRDRGEPDEEQTGRGRRKRGGKRVEPAAPPPEPSAPATAPAAAPFEGPWPVFERVLATSLQIAHERADPNRLGREGIELVRDLALELYKSTLGDLGDVVELDDEELVA